MHVIPWSPFSFQAPAENDRRHSECEEEIDAARAQIVTPMVELTAKTAVPVDTVIRHGNPSDELIDLATAHEAGHLYVGRTGDSGLRVSFFGSVASRLVQHAPIPVTVVP